VFTKKFWEERPFDETANIAEGDAFIRGREQMCRELSPQEVIVSLTHPNNLSSRKIPDFKEPNGCHYGFNEKLFAEKYPVLFEAFSDKDYPIKGSFRMANAKEWSPDVSILNEDQVNAFSALQDQLETAEYSLQTTLELHEKHLGVLEIQKFAQWKMLIVNTKLRVLTGESDGIEGICTWMREAKESSTLRKAELKAEHPDEYESCMIQGAETTALIVDPMAAQSATE
jgi:hypothetical protein